MQVDEERRAADEARGQVTVLERKRIALTTELEDIRSLLETVSFAISNLFYHYIVYPPGLIHE